MNKYKSKGRVLIGRGVILALTPEQYNQRQGLVTPIEGTPPEDGTDLYEVTATRVGFAKDREFWVDETNGNIVSRAGILIESQDQEQRMFTQEELIQAAEREVAEGGRGLEDLDIDQ